MQIQNLRPAVQLDETLDAELESGSLLDILIEKAKKCDLLLIAGASLATDSVYSLVKELAGAVHAAEGAVAMIDVAAPKKYRFEHLVDFYLQMDVQLCSNAIMQTMDKVRFHPHKAFTYLGLELTMVVFRACLRKQATFG